MTFDMVPDWVTGRAQDADGAWDENEAGQTECRSIGTPRPGASPPNPGSSKA